MCINVSQKSILSKAISALNEKNKEKAIKKIIFETIKSLMSRYNLHLQKAIKLVSQYYEIELSEINKILKGTMFDNNIVAIIPNRKGTEMIKHCRYTVLTYKAIHKLILNLFDEKKHDLLECIQIVTDYLKKGNNDDEVVYHTVLSAIRMELNRKNSTIGEIYRRYLDKRIVRMFFEEEEKRLWEEFQKRGLFVFIEIS